MSTLYSTITRALSPGVAISRTDDEDPERVRRQRALLATNSVSELVSCAYSSYRSVVNIHCSALVASTERLAKARQTVASWKQHQSVGTLPQHLRQPAAQVQFTAGYSDTAAAKAAQKALNDAHLEYQRGQLTRMIEARSAEIVSLEAETAPDHSGDKLSAAIVAIGTSIEANYKVPVDVERPAADGDGENAVMHDISWEPSPAAKRIFEEMLADAPVYAQHAVNLTFNVMDQMSRKIEKKRAAANAATSAAADGAGTSGETSTLTKAVQAEVKRVVMGLMPPGPKSKKKTKAEKAKVSHSPTRYHLIADYFKGSGASSPGQDIRPDRYSKVGLPLILPATSDRHAFQEEAQRQEGSRRWETGRRSASQDNGGRGQGRGTAAAAAEAEAEAEEAAAEVVVASDGLSDTRNGVGYSTYDLIVARVAQLTRAQSQKGNRPLIALGDLWMSQPQTMPDYLLSLPLPDTVNIILANASLRYLNELKYAQYVHLSPDVSVPRDILFQLSVGAKYMFHQPTNAKLITESWSDFVRRIRWRLHFLIEGNEDNKPYDPDYDVRLPSQAQAPSLPQYIELGLIEGRRYVNKAFVKARDGTTNQEQFVYTPQIKAVREFLTSNEYVVTGTDKNLGIAVSRKDWIIQKCQDCLDNVNDYRRLMPAEASNILSRKCKEMNILASMAYDNFELGEQLRDFLRSKITLRGTTHHIPTFYGIPKIHKVPTKMRPIIPCHTAIMNPAAKFVSKRLKPIVESAPTIIHGTKDLAQKLSKLNIDPSRKWYIVTGDVVAFYPNIPLTQCLDIVKELHFEHYLAGRRNPHDDHNDHLQRFFSLACDVGNTQLITQFNGQIYEQLNGLAMGVADSPDLANLLGSLDIISNADLVSLSTQIFFTTGAILMIVLLLYMPKII